MLWINGDQHFIDEGKGYGVLFLINMIPSVYYKVIYQPVYMSMFIWGTRFNGSFQPGFIDENQ